MLLLPLLLACGRSAPVVTAVVLPPGWQTVVEEEFELALPPEWEVISAEDGNFAGAMEELARENPRLGAVAQQAQTAIASGQIQLLAFDLDPDHLLPNFTTNLSLGSQELEQPASLSAVAEANERALLANGFERVRRVEATVAGEPASRLRSAITIKGVDGAAVALAVEQVIIVRPQQQYVLTFTTTAGEQARMQPIFEQILGTFRLNARSPR
jgi:hypothetical protein